NVVSASAGVIERDDLVAETAELAGKGEVVDDDEVGVSKIGHGRAVVVCDHNEKVGWLEVARSRKALRRLRLHGERKRAEEGGVRWRDQLPAAEAEDKSQSEDRGWQRSLVASGSKYHKTFSFDYDREPISKRRLKRPRR